MHAIKYKIKQICMHHELLDFRFHTQNTPKLLCAGVPNLDDSKKMGNWKYKPSCIGADHLILNVAAAETLWIILASPWLKENIKIRPATTYIIQIKVKTFEI